MMIATVIAAASWILVVLFLDPASSGTIGVTLFFVSFFLTIFGMASMAGYAVRRLFHPSATPFRLVAVSFRQAALLGLLLTTSLFLQSRQYFTWWTAVSLFAFVSFLEALFAARDGARQRGGSHGT